MKNSTKVRRCLDCPNMTRPSRTLIAEYPGTTQRHGDLCMTCYRLTVKRTGTDPEPRPSIAEITESLAAYLRARHRREDMMNRREMFAERIAS